MRLPILTAGKGSQESPESDRRFEIAGVATNRLDCRSGRQELPESNWWLGIAADATSHLVCRSGGYRAGMVTIAPSYSVASSSRPSGWGILASFWDHASTSCSAPCSSHTPRTLCCKTWVLSHGHGAGPDHQQAIDVGLLAMVNGLVSYPSARVGPRVYIVFNAIFITYTADYVL